MVTMMMIYLMTELQDAILLHPRKLLTPSLCAPGPNTATGYKQHLDRPNNPGWGGGRGEGEV